MASFMSRPARLGLLTVAGLFVIVSILLVSLERLARIGVERIGSHLTKTTVSLEGVSLSLVAGRAVLDRLTIANPSPYQSPTALTARRVTAHLDWKTLVHDPLVITELGIEDPELTFEGSFSSNNLDALRANLQPQGPSSAPTEAGRAPQGRTVIIRRLRITGAKVNVWIRTSTLETKAQGVRIKDVTLENLGDPEHPLSTAEVSTKIFAALTQETLTVLGKTTGGLVGQGADSLLSGAREAGKTLDRAVDGLKQLFSK